MTDRTWRGFVFIATSLDGYIARTNGEIDWLTDPPANIEHAAPPRDGLTGDYAAFMGGIDHIVMGRGTYETVLTFESWPFGQRGVVVLSSTLEEADARVHVVRSVSEAVSYLNAAPATGVYIDGGQVIQAFLAASLIDELTITRAPIILGSGRPLFGQLDHELRLSLRETRPDAYGLTHATYTVAA